jgi:hypothetical protein
VQRVDERVALLRGEVAVAVVFVGELDLVGAPGLRNSSRCVHSTQMMMRMQRAVPAFAGDLWRSSTFPNPIGGST